MQGRKQRRGEESVPQPPSPPKPSHSSRDAVAGLQSIVREVWYLQGDPAYQEQISTWAGRGNVFMAKTEATTAQTIKSATSRTLRAQSPEAPAKQRKGSKRHKPDVHGKAAPSTPMNRTCRTSSRVKMFFLLGLRAGWVHSFVPERTPLIWASRLGHMAVARA